MEPHNCEIGDANTIKAAYNRLSKSICSPYTLKLERLSYRKSQVLAGIIYKALLKLVVCKSSEHEGFTPYTMLTCRKPYIVTVTVFFGSR